VVSGYGGGTITKRMLLAMIIVINVSLLTLGDISATTANISDIEPNIVSETVNNTNDSANYTESQFCSNDTDYNNVTTNTSTVIIQNTSQAAGGDEYSNVHGIWVTSTSANTIDVDALLKAGITDIFVKTNRISTPTYQSVLDTILAKVSGTTLRVHAWITCFKDANGNWIDPQGKYSYQVKVPYTAAVKVAYKKVKYKKWYKKWYKYKGKWKYKWKYKWSYKWLYKTSYVTKYNYVTKYGYNNAYKETLLSFISNITTNYSISGIHLDYIRYSGSGSNAAYLNSGGTGAITSFVANVTSTVKSIKPKFAVSAALMPEGAENAKYYGQDYSQLSQYLDFLVPMIYKGNYKQDTSWIGEKVSYIVANSNGKPVVAGLQTYESDNDTTPIPASELQNDINTAISNGASGYALFRYGLIDSAYMPIKETTAESSDTDPSSGNSDNTNIPSDFEQYMHSTANCQVTAQIMSLAASITSGKTSTYDKAVAIFNWVRDNIGYSFYYNTKYGAQGTLDAKTGNCVDTSHLLIALLRATGIPARYVHGYCQFTSGNWYGHVWAQIYINGAWYSGDATSSRNVLGGISSWNTATYTLKGIYASLPF